MTIAKHDALRPLHALVKDVKISLFGIDHARLDSDIACLTKRLMTRGLTVIMDDLPKLGKVYDKALSSEFFDLSLVPHSLRIKGGDFLFSSLVYRSFQWSGVLIDPDPLDILFARSVFYLYKKVEEETSDENKRLAIAEFYAIDEGLPTPSKIWSSEDFLEKGVNHHAFADDDHLPCGKILRQVLDRICWELTSNGEIHWDDFRPKHGPGAVSDLRRGMDKYSFPSWPRALSTIFPSEGWASHLHDNADDALPETWGETSRNVVSKLICVPKTLSKPRVIASEPTAHQYVQQAVMQAIRQNMTSLARLMVDFNSQERSREMCLQASLDGRNATIDLSAASDRLSCYVVERAIKNPYLLRGLVATRTKFVVSELKPEPQELRKFAPMGSAVTFPVQSLFYAAAALAAVVYERHGSKSLLWLSHYNFAKLQSYAKEIRVFGDDIIIPKDAVPFLVEILESYDLKINRDKSHTNGFFRESCGMDAYGGVDVTPLYLSKTSYGRLSSLDSWVAVRNNAYTKGFWNLSKFMDDSIPSSILKQVPTSHRAQGCVRLFTFLRQDTPHLYLKTRLNGDWQTLESKVFRIRVSRQVERRNDWKDLLQYFIEGPDTSHQDYYLDPADFQVGVPSSYRATTVARWVSLS